MEKGPVGCIFGDCGNDFTDKLGIVRLGDSSTLTAFHGIAEHTTVAVDHSLFNRFACHCDGDRNVFLSPVSFPQISHDGRFFLGFVCCGVCIILGSSGAAAFVVEFESCRTFVEFHAAESTAVAVLDFDIPTDECRHCCGPGSAKTDVGRHNLGCHKRIGSVCELNGSRRLVAFYRCSDFCDAKATLGRNHAADAGYYPALRLSTGLNCCPGSLIGSIFLIEIVRDAFYPFTFEIGIGNLFLSDCREACACNHAA